MEERKKEKLWLAVVCIISTFLFSPLAIVLGTIYLKKGYFGYEKIVRFFRAVAITFTILFIVSSIGTGFAWNNIKNAIKDSQSQNNSSYNNTSTTTKNINNNANTNRDKEKINYNSLEDYLKSKSISFNYVFNAGKLMFKCDYYKDNSCISISKFRNNVDIYIDAKNETLVYNMVNNEKSDLNIQVYLYNDYYILFSSNSTSISSGGKFKIYNSKLQELFKDEYEEEFLLSDNNIYYSIYDCYYGDRLDGTYGAMKGSKKIDLNRNSIEFYTYLNHDSGWKC